MTFLKLIQMLFLFIAYRFSLYKIKNNFSKMFLICIYSEREKGRKEESRNNSRLRHRPQRPLLQKLQVFGLRFKPPPRSPVYRARNPVGEVQAGPELHSAVAEMSQASAIFRPEAGTGNRTLPRGAETGSDKTDQRCRANLPDVVC